MKGDIVYSPEGEKIELVDIGITVLVDNPVVRVWDVTLEGHAQHPWHLHHNPYVVLSLQGSDGRMDWLDGSPERFISEYRGGAVYRPTSPVHRLTNLRDNTYQNRLVELKDLGELLPEPLDIGEGARSVEGEAAGPDLTDGRRPVLDHPHVKVWTVDVQGNQSVDLQLAELPHVLALVDAPDPAQESTGGVVYHDGGQLDLANSSADVQTWFVVELTYLADLDAVLNGDRA
ncbi:hypothetical protein [Nocardioides luteus]|uniref:hypothetical protein n=1 Tax=Nocardioides luteus TaxID=1844 RepID=UPI0018CB5E85|nr:hypothetical protein [Nocardioides luteus]MBG6096828.1 hypothetical protein [Nocardioides luteus]